MDLFDSKRQERLAAAAKAATASKEAAKAFLISWLKSHGSRKVSSARA